LTNLLLALVGCGAAFWCFRRWWSAVRWILVLLVFEGAIRKWLLPGQQQLVYLAKDVLFAAIVAGYVTSRMRARRVRISPLVVIPLLGCALWGALEILNPKLPSILVGVFGWKAYFWYAPLLWIVPAAFRDLEDLEKFLRRYVLLVIPIVVLGLIQFRSPTTSAINRYAWGEEEGVGRIATFGAQSAARVTGTFTYISGYTTYLVAMGVMLLIVLGLRGFRLRGSGAEWLAFLSLPIGIFVSGSRGPLVLLAGVLPLFILLARRGVGAKAGAVMRLVVGAAVAAALTSYIAMPALEAFVLRATSTGENVALRAIDPFIGPVKIIDESGMLGYGIGATHQAAGNLVRGMLPGSWLEGLVAETESTRVMIEIGPVGFLLHFMYRVALVGVVAAAARRAKLQRSRVTALGSALFLLAQLPGAIVFNVYAGIFFWFFAGCAFLAAAEEREAAPLKRVPDGVMERNLARAPARLSAG